jgi:hypothetical protein
VGGSDRVGDRRVGDADVDLAELRQLAGGQIDPDVAALVAVECEDLEAVGGEAL